ncbi:restriction endonuclease [Methanospirillum purgamenti]|uniref:Restriction endonuclease n=1 Tax=Methanospirillum hungatei TaxID=2203 RepID=A0A8F5ZFH7_METHU|nr:restriction endonuclease [Methanospirillum hungatei]QXO95530.1 restriction endonuclease [Methanospirillum hungatei]
MAIPDYQTVMLPVLLAVKDGKEHPVQEIYRNISLSFNLSADELNQKLPSGVQSTFDNRVGCAKTYLKKAGLVTTPSRGKVKITERGLVVLSQNPKRIDQNFLKLFPEFLDFKDFRTNNQTPLIEKSDTPESTLTPQEILENSYQDVRNKLAHELLSQVMSSSPEFFERLVVDLLVAMGYGGSRSEAGERVGKTGDDGIDGIIKEDKLGLDTVCIQAKRWQNTVGRPEIQAFVGSLAGNRARKGVFITTSRFSREAREYVQRIEQKVVLIDGETLAELMIDHNVGVSEESRYIVKKIDMDYFEE